MRRQPLLWLTISIVCFVGAFYFWKLGERKAASRHAPPAAPATTNEAKAGQFQFVSRSGNLNSTTPADPVLSATNRALRFAYRLSNTSAKIGELSRNPDAILLENALIDTKQPLNFTFPAHLQAGEEPGAWIVQAPGAAPAGMRSLISSAGAQYVAYIPNNAFLVTGSKESADKLAASPGVQTVLAYEPYYKLKSSLLRTAAQMQDLPKDATLRVLLFPNAAADTIDALTHDGAEVLSQSRSPFGLVVDVRPQPSALPAIARLPGVQVVELAHERIPANDRSRPAITISTNTTTEQNYLGLTGTNVLVNVNDTGVDVEHPDLSGRVFVDAPISGVDSNGHGTHVAGIIGSSGGQSLTVTGALGSVMPPTNGQFRGKAPGAKLFSMHFSRPDIYLQENAARTNALISNNSWQYRSAYEYDLAAASFDAAVRDSLPEETGSQPMLYVFAAGNAGSGSSDGIDGTSDSIVSPGTAKNVITVGAYEQQRKITNEVWECFQILGETICNTNRPWAGDTDSDDQVAGFSSRGNVGVSVEGENGRFKPDVVAPGAMIVSTRSGQWDINTYYNNTNHIVQTRSGIVRPGELFYDFLFLSERAIEASIRVVPNEQSVLPFPDMPIYLSTSGVPTNGPGGYDFLGTNVIHLPADYPLSPLGQEWTIGVGNYTSNAVALTVITDVVVTNASNYNEVLKGLNDGLGPYYRYESGSSMAAAQVSGTLALMHEFFTTRLQRTNSPALMKALLINGARNLNPEIYDFQTETTLNSQGWGTINLTNTLPADLATVQPGSAASVLYFDQNPTNALVTGASHTYRVNASPDASFDSMRVTLAWTDPPGNPVASIKLVNDLDLVVTNLDTGDVYFGNDIRQDNDVSTAWDTNTVPKLDVVNNVERIMLNVAAGTNFSVTVIGRHVNVNAVSAHTNDVAQDYALVISSGDGTISNALSLGTITAESRTVPYVTIVTNAFEGNPDYSGNVLYGQHAGASTPLLGTNSISAPTAGGVITLGMTNQWHFYAISNEFGFTNAAFMTFIPPNLAVPRMGATQFDVDNASRVEADVDMYVTTEAGITNLDPAILDRAKKALGRNGSETVILNDAIPAMYYVGVKAEDQMAAEYAFAGVFSRFPFNEEDAMGNQYVRGFPVPQAIPDAYVNTANKILGGYARILGFSVGPDLVRRVIVTNSLTHELVGDLVGTLGHGRDSVVLLNHTTNEPAPFFLQDGRGYNYPAWVYDDSGEMNVPFSHASDGPGTLQSFGGKEGAGQWMFTQADTAVTHIGTNGPLWLFIEKQPDLEDGIVVDIEPGACRMDYVRVPAEATNLTIEVTQLAGTGPISLMLCPLDQVGGCATTLITNGIGGSVSIDLFSDPPLRQGVYSVRTCNLGTDKVTVRIVARIYRGAIIRESLSTSSGAVDLKDDAITYAYITNLTNMRISSLDVGLLFNHPRISDMAITLISPNGTRVLLYEDRGGVTTEGMGNLSSTTNGLGEVVWYTTRMEPFYRSDFDRTGIGLYSPSSRIEDWRILTNYASVLPDWEVPWRSNNILSLDESIVHLDLPTTNTSGIYNLTFKATHAPYLTGTVGWWPFDRDGRDIFGGFDALLLGGGNTTNFTMFSTGRVYNAFYGDSIRTSARVPAAPELDLAKSGFTVEGWIYPKPRFTSVTNAATTNNMAIVEGPIINPANNHSYYLLTNSDWLSAEAAAIQMGGHLVTINDAEENAFVWNRWGTGRNLWIGLQDPVDSGVVRATNFVWTSGDTSTYRNWRAGEPNFGTGSDYYVYMYGNGVVSGEGLWNNAPSVTSLTAEPPLFGVVEIAPEDTTPDPAPLVEWVNQTNGVAGLKFWVSGLSYTNQQPGALVAAFGTNFQQVIATDTNLLKNWRWQHVALSYNPVSRQAVIYTNGSVAASAFVQGDLDPVTVGDLYFGFHPADATNVASFKGGLDEFGLYKRPLTDCEIEAIFNAGRLGKYGTNALTCPVSYEVTLQTDTTTILTYTNGLFWTNGPAWEMNSITFTNPVLSAVTNGPATNLTGITIRPLSPNVALDEFVLSGLVSNRVSGAMQFTENTNLALLPIKFAPTPYLVSNFPPTLVFSNNFVTATQGLYRAGMVVPGLDLGTNTRNWNVTDGAVTVLSNRMLNPEGTNSLVLGESAVQSTLPTIPGHRYELTYSLRGPGAVGWWNGDIEPLSGRAKDLIGGNDGAFVNLATNAEAGYIAQPNAPDNALYLPVGEFQATNPYPTVAFSPRIELSDPANLRLTNALTIEGWIYPRNTQTNFNVGVGTTMQMIFYRGDGRDCLDPYYLALYYHESIERYDVVFHVEDASGRNCGFDLVSTNQPIRPDRWQHVAAVFESNVPATNAPVGTNGLPVLTNQLSIFVDGNLMITGYTPMAPFANLDPAYTPGASIGNRSRYSRLAEEFTDAQPFYGYIDELTVYGRALTSPEVSGIHGRGFRGKADMTVAPAQSLSNVRALVDGIQVDLAYGMNDRFTSRTVSFTAVHTNTMLAFEGLLPGTILGDLRLVEVPAEMNYLPEENLSALIGENTFGVWTLEMWDTRAGGSSTNGPLQLVDWRLDFQMAPQPLPALTTLEHGIPSENTLPGYAVQFFAVPFQMWATNSTNILLWATNRLTGAPAQLGVLFDGTNQPTTTSNALFWPPVSSGTNLLGTNNAVYPFGVPGQNYYLTVTNPNPEAVAFSLGVWFNMPSLTNCQPAVDLANPAGVPRYYQFDVPKPGPGDPPRQVVFSLTGAQSNLTLVVSDHLPLPTLTKSDYVSSRPSTNDEVVMVLTNGTPFPLQQGRWYAGVYNSQGTNVPYTIQACYSGNITNAPRLIPLTNNLPFIAPWDSEFAAPPGVPQWTFYEFDLTNNANAMLFELYNMTGDADLIVQRHVPSGMAPYFDGSFRTGTNAEAVVVRASAQLADLRGKWYLGVYNNESTNVGYTVRATLPDNIGLLNTALPLMLRIYQAAGPHGIVLEWNSIPGEVYIIEYSPNAFPVQWQPFPMAQPIIATTPMSAIELPLGTSGRGFFRVRHVARDTVLIPPMRIRLEPDGRIRISWNSAFTGLIVQATSNLTTGFWFNTNIQPVLEGAEFAIYDTPGVGSRFYRLIAQ